MTKPHVINGTSQKWSWKQNNRRDYSNSSNINSNNTSISINKTKVRKSYTKKNIKIDDERCITKNASKTKKIVKTVYTNEWADEIFEIKTKSRNNRNSRRTHTRRGFKEDKKQHKKAFYKSEILNDGEE